MPTIKVKGHTRNGKKVKPYTREVGNTYHTKILSNKKDWKEFVPKEHQKEHLDLVKQSTNIKVLKKGKKAYVDNYTKTPYKDFAGRKQFASKEQAEQSHKYALRNAKRYGLIK